MFWDYCNPNGDDILTYAEKAECDMKILQGYHFRIRDCQFWKLVQKSFESFIYYRVQIFGTRNFCLRNVSRSLKFRFLCFFGQFLPRFSHIWTSLFLIRISNKERENYYVWMLFNVFRGLQDDLKSIWKSFKPWALSCTEKMSTDGHFLAN